MIQIDTFPTDTISGFPCRAGRVLPFGATIVDGAVNFSVYSKEATSCTLVLYHHSQKNPFAKIPFPEEYKLGNVYSMMVFGLDIETTEYGYIFDGEYDPKTGLYFDKNKVLLDPYASSVSGRSVWGQRTPTSSDFQHRGHIIRNDYDWEKDAPLRIPKKDLIIYEAHVRSMTMNPNSKVRHQGTYNGLIEKIPHLKELGINCIELMPIFEFDEFENYREKDGKPLYNYWGYSTVCFFAPKAGYAASAPFGMEADELKNMVKKLHQNGIEVILDVVFNHTAEGNENGPYISYKGIDNRTYYIMTPDGYYYNFSGCGNTMNCNNAVVRNMILDCLRYWVSYYHIDGFRFDLASIMTRDENGAPMVSPPLLENLSRDPVLGTTKLIAEAWDAGGLYQVGSFPSWNRWSEWNGRYRDVIRRFVKSDESAAPELMRRIEGSPDMYGSRSSSASINFVTCHDGFTLHDLVSYNDKHNESNGEDGRDGSNDNYSWNCGVEGDTDDPKVNDLRLRQMKNFMTILLTSRGIPMLLSGDEMGKTQKGNNNAYCQDNEISWIDWSLLSKNRDFFEYTKAIIALRNSHPVIRKEDFFEGKNATGYPEMSFHGLRPWEIDRESATHTFAYMYAEPGALSSGSKKKHDTFIYVAVNAHWEEHSFELPIIPDGYEWKVYLRSDNNTNRIGSGGYTDKIDSSDNSKNSDISQNSAISKKGRKSSRFTEQATRKMETISGAITLGARSTAILISAK